MKNKNDNFWNWVEQRRMELGISSFRQLEKKAGFSPGSIGKRKNELKLPTVEMAVGLCQALRVDWVELWSQAGYVAKLPAISDLVGLDAEIYQALDDQTDDFKNAVLKTIKTWRQHEATKK